MSRRLPFPRFKRGRWSLAAVIIALIGWGVWQFTPLEAIYSISTLSDPAKLATLGKRGANPRVNKIVYWLDEGRRRGASPEVTLDWAFRLNGTTEPRAPFAKATLVRNLKIAEELGILTEVNRDRLRRGLAGHVSRGPYTGQEVEIDHIVPVSLVPELDKELANLEMLPEKLNQRKSNRVEDRQLAVAAEFAKAGLITQESLNRLRQNAGRK